MNVKFDYDTNCAFSIYTYQYFKNPQLLRENGNNGINTYNKCAFTLCNMHTFMVNYAVLRLIKKNPQLWGEWQ